MLGEWPQTRIGQTTQAQYFSRWVILCRTTLQQLMLVGVSGGCRSRRYVQFIEDVAQVARHGLFADFQLLRDLAICDSGRHQSQDFDFTVSEWTGLIGRFVIRGRIKKRQVDRGAQLSECITSRRQFVRRRFVVALLAVRVQVLPAWAYQRRHASLVEDLLPWERVFDSQVVHKRKGRFLSLAFSGIRHFGSGSNFQSSLPRLRPSTKWVQPG